MWYNFGYTMELGTPKKPGQHTQFMPNRPIKGVVRSRSSIHLIDVVGVMIFAVALMATIGVFIYEAILQNQLDDMRQQIVDFQVQFNNNDFIDITHESDRLFVADKLLANHVATSLFLESLGTEILPSVQVTNLSFNKQDQEQGGGYGVTVAGEALDPASLKQQTQELQDMDVVAGVSFVNYSPIEDTDRYEFQFEGFSPEENVEYKQVVANEIGSLIVEEEEEEPVEVNPEDLFTTEQLLDLQQGAPELLDLFNAQ